MNFGGCLQEDTYTIVSDQEMDIKRGKISVQSPVGKAILGTKLGNKVKVTAPKGEYKIEILQIL